MTCMTTPARMAAASSDRTNSHRDHKPAHRKDEELGLEGRGLSQSVRKLDWLIGFSNLLIKMIHEKCQSIDTILTKLWISV